MKASERELLDLLGPEARAEVLAELNAVEADRRDALERAYGFKSQKDAGNIQDEEECDEGSDEEC